jgi:tyrosinase
MGDVAASPGDPLFYLHHSNLDRLFWTWQKADLSKRLTDVSGPINMLDYDNVIGGNVTLDFEIDLGPLGKTRKLKELMDVRTLGELDDGDGGWNCYEYDSTGALST